MIIRPEQPTDQRPIDELLVLSFPTPAEARLVTLLRQAGRLTYAWIAEHEQSIVGFIGFSPLTLAGESCNGLGLASCGNLVSVV
jgi:putative acetyltransferase